MRAGQLDRRITLQKRTVTQSESGDEIVSWADIATVWAQKIENRGVERFAAQQFVGHAIRTFRFRWSSTVDVITVKDRVLFDDRVFDITDVRELGRREGLEVDCYAPSEEPVTS